MSGRPRTWRSTAWSATPARGLDRFLKAEADTMKVVPSGCHRGPTAGTDRGNNQEDQQGRQQPDRERQLDHRIRRSSVPRRTRRRRAVDVAATTLDSVRAFKQAHYTPGRCIVAVVGEVSAAMVFSLADQVTLSDIPKAVPLPEAPPHPVAPGERRRAVESIAGPRLLVSFRKPPAPSRDDAVAEVVASLLGRGAESRLPGDLTAAKKLTAEVTAGNGGPGLRYDNLLTIGAVPAAGVRPERSWRRRS